MLFPYYFRIEQLGNDECGLIKKDQYNHMVTSDYYRITLWVVLNQARDKRLILQSTLAKAGSDPLSCRSKIHIVASGRQMLREL